jgi:protein-tyrosine phosphatase
VQEVSRVEGFVDIHTHILPGVDDGAQDLPESLELLKRACAQGTGAVVLTPHYRGRYRDNGREKLTGIFERLCEAAKTQCPELELYLGCEVGYELDVSEKIADGTVLPLNGTQYVLLEFREDSFRSRILDGVLEVLNFGYVPIIAHAERYHAFRKHPKLADEVTELGALIQLNADSVLGKCGFGIKRYCHRLLKSHLVHFIATDAHDQKSRKPELAPCYRRIQKKYGQAYADALLIRNGRAVLAGSDSIEC